MKAPEKLYVDNEDRLTNSILYGFTEKRKEDDIEYIRKDAFIDRACDAYCKICKMPNCRSSECRLISDFKEYLENI